MAANLRRKTGTYFNKFLKKIEWSEHPALSCSLAVSLTGGSKPLYPTGSKQYA
jgi:hypothetical protein